jgi:hypothetical protein
MMAALSDGADEKRSSTRNRAGGGAGAGAGRRAGLAATGLGGGGALIAGAGASVAGRDASIANPIGRTRVRCLRRAANAAAAKTRHNNSGPTNDIA